MNCLNCGCMLEHYVNHFVTYFDGVTIATLSAWRQVAELNLFLGDHVSVCGKYVPGGTN